MKKPIITFIVCGFLAGTFFFSCENKNQKIFDRTVFDSVKVNETVHLFADTAAPGNNLVIDYVFPVKSENQSFSDSVNKELVCFSFGAEYENLDARSAIDSFKNNYMKEYLEEVGPLYVEDKKLNPDAASRSWFDYYQSIDVHPLKVNDNILVYKVQTSSYTGGAHGMYSTTYFNFTPQTGDLIRLKDLFKPGYEKKLEELLLHRLMKNTGSTSLQELQDKAYLQDTDMYASENFCLSNEGITFLYNVYEIAPYSSGITEIFLPYGEMEDIMNQDQKWN